LPELNPRNKQTNQSRGINITRSQNFYNTELQLNPRGNQYRSTSKDAKRLTADEKEMLKYLKEKEISKYKQQIGVQFNSEKNWSTMISGKNNDIRNSIMQNLKLQQVKRRKLREFLRTSKETIIGSRHSMDFKEGI